MALEESFRGHRFRSLTEPLQHRHSLGSSLTFLKDLGPQPHGLGYVAPLLGQHGQVAKRQVAVNALIDAAKLLRPA